MQWFDVDKAGLAKLLARKGVEFILYELIQNAWDELTTTVDVTLVRIQGTKYVRLIVRDDNPTGFANLSHAFTLFAESNKKSDPNKRGRFNLGEKLVLALCEEAEISTTTGTVRFDSDGRHMKRHKTEAGSCFTGVLRMTNEQLEHCHEAIEYLIPPDNIVTCYNDVQLVAPTLVGFVDKVSLATELGDEEGLLRKTVRQTTINIFEPKSGQKAMLYEMGIPVVELGDDRWHINIGQKVPLTIDRENVPPSYLSRVRFSVLDEMEDCLTVAEANATWVKDAFEKHGDDLSEDTVKKVVDLRFGPKRVSYDPSDSEANKLAVSKGYTVVHGNSMSKAEWEAVRRTAAILPAGQVTPSPKPFSPSGDPLKLLPYEKWTPEIKSAVSYIRRIGSSLIGFTIDVSIANDPGWGFVAAYGKNGSLTINLAKVHYTWFADLLAINGLLIHELGHQYSSDHLSEKYHDALCELGSRMAQLALNNPALFVL